MSQVFMRCVRRQLVREGRYWCGYGQSSSGGRQSRIDDGEGSAFFL